MRLVWHEDERPQLCTVLTFIVNKEFSYYTNASITRPNAEISEYSTFELKGLIMVCLKMCDVVYYKCDCCSILILESFMIRWLT